MSTDNDDLEARVAELERQVEKQHETIAGIFKLLHVINHAIPRPPDDLLNLLTDED